MHFAKKYQHYDNEIEISEKGQQSSKQRYSNIIVCIIQYTKAFQLLVSLLQSQLQIFKL